MFAAHVSRMKVAAVFAVLALAGTSTVAVADDQLPDDDPVVVEEQQLLDEASTAEPTPVVDEELEQTVENSEQTVDSEQTDSNEALPSVIEPESASSDEPTQAAGEADGDVADTESGDTDSTEEADSELELAATNVVSDKDLRKCVNRALGLGTSQDRAVTAAQMKSLKKLNCYESAKSFEGIQYATNATELWLWVENGANLSALEKLSSTKLTQIWFWGSTYSKVKVQSMPNMAKAKNLTDVKTSAVTFTNYSNLSKISKLQILSVENTDLKDISFVAKLPTLLGLNLPNNEITDITPVMSLKKLQYLNVSENRISTLPKLKAGMKKLTGVDFSKNSIRDLRNASTWAKPENSKFNEQALFRIKPVFKNGNTEINLSSFYDDKGKQPVKASRAERVTTELFRPLSGLPGTVTNGGKTAVFKGKLAEGEIIYVENTSLGSYFIRVGDSKVREITIYPEPDNGKSHTVTVGDTFYLTVGAAPWDSLNTKVTASSSNPKVATISPATFDTHANRSLTGKARTPGTTTITVAATDGSGVKASVKVTVVEKQCSLQPGPASFTDVPASHPFAKDISWLSQRGISKGWPDNTFGPQLSVHRDAFAAFLYRMACEPKFTPPKVSPFKDVPTNHPFYKEITWAASKGITKGWPDGTFRPDVPITRDAIAAFLYRFAGQPKFTVTKTFKDIAGNEHRKAIEWLGSTGVSTGWADGTYRPGLFTERGAIAAFLHRYSDKGIPIAVL